MTDVDPNLVAIKQREQNAKDAIRRGEREVDVGSFGAGQLGLTFAMCDAYGRIWRDAGGGKIVLVYAPRPPMMAAGDLSADGADLRPGAVSWLPAGSKGGTPGAG